MDPALHSAVFIPIVVLLAIAYHPFATIMNLLIYTIISGLQLLAWDIVSFGKVENSPAASSHLSLIVILESNLLYEDRRVWRRGLTMLPGKSPYRQAMG